MNSASSPQRGFTLVEMLVSVTILSFMMIMMAKITGLVEMTWHQAQNRIDNYTKARSMLDLISSDLQRAVFRGDLPIFGKGPTSTPAITSSGLYYFTATAFTTAFYTRLPGTSGTSTPVRDVSLVSYTLIPTTDEDKMVLQRSALSVPWTSGTNLSFQSDITPLLSNSNAVASEVAPGVVGFRLVFRRADGSLIDQSAYTGYNSANPVIAVNAGLAVINRQCLTVLSSPQITELAAVFSSGTMTNGVKTTWDQQLNNSFYASYPKVLGDGLKTYECWVGCTPF